jgi:hypothetical protein
MNVVSMRSGRAATVNAMMSGTIANATAVVVSKIDMSDAWYPI